MSGVPGPSAGAGEQRELLARLRAVIGACCGAVTFAEPPPGARAGSVSYGAVLNAAAVVLTGYGNVPPGGPRR